MKFNVKLIYQIPDNRIAGWLLLILVLFAFRVFSQLATLYFSISFFPKFNDWHSAALPYPILLLSQLLILVGGFLYLTRIRQGGIVPKPFIGKLLYSFAWLYWSLMFLRLISGLTILSDQYWFAQNLPALFHLILANGFMLIAIFNFQERNSNE